MRLLNLKNYIINKQFLIMKKQLLLLLFSLFAVAGYARVITGTVIAESDKFPVIGATIMVQGTQRGVATDFDGKFSIEVKDGDVLNISYVGMLPQTVKIGNQETLNIVLKENSQVLSEVVVTAMGQTQEKKKLNFAVQSLDSDQLTAGVSTNLASTLQGKVSGLQIQGGGGSPNASQSITIRAISSVNTGQNNEPLIILDGIAVRGSGSTLNDINPNDIEHMTVLKGAAASALYGQEAANGVIMIVTKSGKNGKLQLNANATFEVSNAARVPKLQSRYSGGTKGFYIENSAGGGWGPLLSSTDQIYDNVGEFLGTGFLQKYDISMTGGTEKANAYASVSYSQNEGVVVEDYKNQINVFLKGQFDISDKVKVQLSTSFKESKARGFGNSMSTVYGWSINENMADYETAEGYPNWANRYDNWAVIKDENKIDAGISPYFSRYNDKSETQTTRVMLNGQITYEPIKDLILTGKIGYDKSYSMYDAYTVPRFRPSDFEDPNNEAFADYAYKFGSYTFQPSRGERFNAQMMATYEKEIFNDVKINLLAGADWTEVSSIEASLAGQRFMLEGEFYSFANIDPSTFITTGDYPLYLNHSKWNKFGYFGELRFDYRGIAQVSVTGRLDGASQMKQAEQTTYFYPSITGGFMFSELFNLANNWFSYGKIRGNWAKVGKSGPAYKFTDSFRNMATFPDGGWGIDPTIGRAYTLEPEMCSSWEIGADLRFFKSRTRLDLAYYSTTVDNQIVTVRVSPAAGMILQTRNEGTVENYGIEATLAQDIFKTKDFDWTATANFSLNRGKLKSLPDGIVQIDGTAYGAIVPTSYVGGSTTGLTGKDYVRDPEGNVVVNENGYPLIQSTKQVYIGNREPDFLLGVGSNFRYKDLTVGFLFDGRCGGDVANITGQSLISNGQSHLFDKYRNREVIFNGVVASGVDAEGNTIYTKNTTPVILDQNFINTYFYGIGTNFIEDGSYIRLSYVTIGYDLKNLLSKKSPIKGLNVSLTGRNLFLLTKYSGSDPQIQVSGANGSGGGGFDYYAVPNTRTFNLSLKATF